MSHQLGLGDDVLMSAAFVGSGALVSLAFSSPIGALGGAVIGGIVYLTGKPIVWLSTKLFNDNHLISQIVCYAVAVFATAFVAFKIGQSICLVLPFMHVFALTGTTYLVTALFMLIFEVGKREFFLGRE
jgi:hypothetical protein